MYTVYKQHLSYILPVTTIIGLCSGVYLSMKYKLHHNGNTFIMTLIGNTYIGIMAGYLYPVSVPLLVGYAVHTNNHLHNPGKFLEIFINKQTSK